MRESSLLSLWLLTSMQVTFAQPRMPDSVGQLLVFFQQYTKDRKLLQAIDEVQNHYSANLSESLFHKLLHVEQQLSRTSMNQSKVFSYNKALTHLSAQLSPNGEHRLYVYSLEGLAAFYQRLRHYQLADSLYRKALLIRKKIWGEDHLEFSAGLHNLAGLYYVWERYSESLDCYQKELAIKKEILGDQHYNYAITLIAEAWLYHQMGRYNDALPLCQEALGIIKKTTPTDGAQHARCLSDLARLYHRMGQYEKALPLYEHALTAAKEAWGKEHAEYAVCLINLAYFYHTITAQYQKAFPLYQQALLIIQYAGEEEHAVYLNTINNLANLNCATGQYEKALPLYERALKLVGQKWGKEHPAYADGLSKLSALHYLLKHSDTAKHLCSQAFHILENAAMEQFPRHTLSLSNLAGIYYRSGKYDTALHLLHRYSLLTKITLGEAHPDYATSLSNLAMIYTTLGNETTAEPLLVKASSIALTHLLKTYTSLSEEEKIAVLLKQSSQFHLLPAILTAQKKNNPKLSNQIYTNELALKAVVLEDQRAVLRTIRNKKDQTNSKILEQWLHNKAFIGTQLLLHIKDRVKNFDSLLEETNRLEQVLSMRTADSKTSLQSMHLTAKDVSEKLSRGQAAIEFIRYSLGTNKQTDSILYAALILSSRSDTVHFIPLFEEKQLERLLMRFSGFASSELAVKKLYGNGTRSLNDSLYGLIWKPLEAYLSGIQSIYYAPAGLLHRIAFAAIRSPADGYLIDTYKLHQVMSTRSIVTVDKAVKQPHSASLWGNIEYTIECNNKKVTCRSKAVDSSFIFYNTHSRGFRMKEWSRLPGTNKEINSIEKQFEKAGIHTIKKVSGLQATEEAFKALDGRSPQVLHLATHGFSLPATTHGNKENENAFKLQQNPMLRSGLVLAGGNNVWMGKPVERREDGILTAYEIAQMDLSGTDLVVLSACETALGDLKGSEGVIGLQRAFKLAGANRFIVSLWNVSDEPTKELMDWFYHYWLNGQSTEEALRQAQLNIKAKYPDPYYWAGFVLVK
jgi:CHAT domain-containing protein